MTLPVPLAVSGLEVISVVVVAALGLLYYLFRAERDYQEEPPEGENAPPDWADRGERAPRPDGADPGERAPRPDWADPGERAPRPDGADPGERAPRPDGADPGERAPRP